MELLNTYTDFIDGDLVIHLEYGVGRFIGLESVNFNGITKEFLKIEYADNAYLFIPVENGDIITKYGSFNEDVKLDKLSKQSCWTARKNKIKKNIKELSDKLINIASMRKLKRGQIFSVNNGSYEEFCNDFMFEPTKDQLKATTEIIDDLSSGKLMDRLLCGDVGFGKTEVAIRASFVVVDNNCKGQVAVIVPTTLLCRQHYKQFCERFKNTDYKIACISRLTNPKDIKQIKKDLELGSIDIIIGTHSLLNGNIKYKNLGLVIIDEEQRFGVNQKEKIKEITDNVHILSMSATPIPRTLQMSIAGIRDLSLIKTPPINRVNVETIVCQYEDQYIKGIINNEIKRGGRVFIVVPRIVDTVEIENRLKSTIPNLEYCIIHGQMKNETVDILMNDFYDGKYKVLIATTIVESGIDVPIANTIIIYKANNFGLAQLYQLRGRVGRSGVNAFAYLTTKKTDIISTMAEKRLEIIASIKNLDSGFLISNQDMDMRGIGNILGEEQSGHVKDIGVELYNSMLVKAMNKNKQNNIETEEDEFSPEIKLHVSTIIPFDYINDISIKMNYYRKISCTEDEKQINNIKREMVDSYGNIPESVENLFKTVILKNKCKKLNIQKLNVNEKNISVIFHNNLFAGIDKLIGYSMNNKNIILKQNSIIFNDINIDDVLNLLNSCLDV